MQFVPVSSGVLHVVDTGDRGASTATLLIHSLGTDNRLWSALLDSWQYPGRVIRFDLRGHGLSSCPSGPWSLDALVKDTVELIDRLDVEEIIVVGISLGGLIAQALAVQHPDRVRAMVISNSAARMGTPELWAERIARIDQHGMPAIAESVLQRWFAPDWGSSAERLGWRNVLVRTPAAGYAACCQVIADADLRTTTGQLSVPTLAIAGGRDEACTPAEVKNTAALIPGAAYACIDEAAHLPCVDATMHYLRVLAPFVTEHAS